MGLDRWLFLFIVATSAVACGAATPFGFKYYNLKPVSFEGKLEGATDKEDLPLSVCKPSGGEVNRCVVMLTREAYRLKEEVLQLRQKVKDLERRCPTN